MQSATAFPAAKFDEFHLSNALRNWPALAHAARQEFLLHALGKPMKDALCTCVRLAPVAAC